MTCHSLSVSWEKGDFNITTEDEVKELKQVVATNLQGLATSQRVSMMDPQASWQANPVEISKGQRDVLVHFLTYKEPAEHRLYEVLIVFRVAEAEVPILDVLVFNGVDDEN